MPCQCLVCLLCITCASVVVDKAHSLGILDLVHQNGKHKCLLDVEVLPFCEDAGTVIISEHIGASV